MRIRCISHCFVVFLYQNVSFEILFGFFLVLASLLTQLLAVIA